MPATAGRVRMPAGNRIHSSAALATHGIWANTIGQDKYAPSAAGGGVEENTANNVFEINQGLLKLAQSASTSQASERGSCRKCNGVGHFTHQCRNFLSANSELDEILESTSSDSSDDDDGGSDDSAGGGVPPAPPATAGGKRRYSSDDDDDDEGGRSHGRSPPKKRKKEKSSKKSSKSSKSSKKHKKEKKRKSKHKKHKSKKDR